MKMLLTSAGVRNKSIHQALTEMLPKPISDCRALAIPTAAHPMTNGAFGARRFLVGDERLPMTNLGWKEVGLFELTALPSIDSSVWRKHLDEIDVLLVNGGDPLYLSHWMIQSGVAEYLRTNPNLLYLAFSAGSMVLTPRIGKDFVNWQQPGSDDQTLGLVDFSIFPHLDHPSLPENTMADAERWAEELKMPAYAICDETAISVIDGEVKIISEGSWRRFN